MNKLDTLLENEGYEDELDFLEDRATDNCVPGICMNEDCDYTTDYEPDQGKGWCEVCNTGTVKSALLLIGII